MAASVAYYAFVSLIPALLLLLVAATAVFGGAVAEFVLTAVADFITPTGRGTIEDAFESATGRTSASVVGVGVLAWTNLKMFRALNTAFISVYGVNKRPDLLDELGEATVVAVSIGVGIVAMIGMGVTVAALEPGRLVGAASMLAMPVLLTALFFPMYYILPPDVHPREAVPGAVVAAIGWTVLRAGFQAYALRAGTFQVYGVIGGVLVLVTWLYIAAIVVILGAVVNAVLAGETEGAVGGAGPEPDLGPDDRQLQQAARRTPGMAEREGTARGAGGTGPDDAPRDGDAAGAGAGASGDRTGDADRERPEAAPDVAALAAEVRRLRAELDAFEADVEERTVERPRLEAELKRYVRRRLRRGHARGWGPYLVLLYGTAMVLGAFYFLRGGWAIAAMLIVLLSTLGLYTLFVLVGVGLGLVGTPGRALDYLRDRRE